MTKSQFRHFIAALILGFCTSVSLAQIEASLSPDLQQKIDVAANEVLQQTGVPSASVAVVKDGKIAFVQAYGKAKLEPPTPAKPEIAFQISGLSQKPSAQNVGTR